MKPTEMAALSFRNAARKALIGDPQGIEGIQAIAMAIGYLAQGLEDMNTGLRATYIKLEEVEALLKRPGGPQGQR